MKIYQGTVISCDKNDSVFNYLVEESGIIKFVGNQLPEMYRGRPVIALGEKALLPSFADTHVHLSSYSFFSSNLDVRNANSIGEIIELISEYISNSNNKFVLGFGVSANNVAEKRLIGKSDLDKHFQDIPVMLIKYDGHASVCNSRMLEMLPSGMKSLRGFNFDSGQMFQEAYFAATDHITKLVSPVALVRNTVNCFNRLAEKGIGMVHTVEGVGFPNDVDVDLIRFVSKGLKNRFSVRLFFQTMDTGKVIRRRLPRIGGCFACALDGCFGSEDAALIDPYVNDPANRGVLFYSQDVVNDFVKRANRQELQVELHAIGDRAFEQAVDAIGFALKDHPRKDHRHTVIHACLPTKRGLDMAAELGIGIASQPAFINWNLEPLEYVERILGKRAYNLNPLNTMVKSGLKISGGSDAPCTLPDPIDGIFCACNNYVGDESISVMEALKMFTINAAWMTFDEKERGSLESGKIADMTVLNRNPLSLDPKKLKELNVERLFLSGKEFKEEKGLSGLLLNNVFGKNKKI
jgi:predicted amidohydrolase YtcJ